MDIKKILDLHDDLYFILDEINIIYKRTREALWLVDNHITKLEKENKKKEKVKSKK